MTLYANAFWSPDYASGIDRLSRQLVLSLGQLHELRMFVFNYMKYLFANGEYLLGLADASYPIDSSFKNSRGPRKSRNISGIRQVSRTHRQYEEEQALEFDMDYIFRQFIERTRKDLRIHQKTALEIEVDVLERITMFLKHHEPRVKHDLAELADRLEEYKHSFARVEASKQEYTTIARLGEFLIHKETTSNESPHSDHENTQLQANDSDSKHRQIDNHDLKLPLVVSGVTLFQSHESFAKFMSHLVRLVPVSRRKIPLPGYRNEIFSSEHLCDAIKRERPRNFNPTRSNLEKLGQVLLDMKMLVGTGFFAKKFNSESMWFEWSEAAIELSEKKVLNKPKPTIDETWTHMTANTTKRFNGVLKSMQSSLSKPRYSEEDLSESEDKYNEAYVVLHKQKHLLEMQIIHASQNLEQFEKRKIELVFQSLTRLLQILSTMSTSFSAEFESFSQRFVSELNRPQNYTLEFNTGLETFSTGVYFPSVLSPEQSLNRHAGTSHLNTNFQNIRLSFDLFKDIPLQAKLADVQKNTPLYLQSVPVFLHDTLMVLETFPKSELSLAWKLTINYKQYWLMKDDLTGEFQDFEPQEKDAATSDLALLDVAVQFLKDKDASRVMNFLKNWLLETADSIIPSTVHDSLVANYKITRPEEDSAQRLAETVKILGNLPRSNLSSVLFVLEHICNVFGLDVIRGFGQSDELLEMSPVTSDLKIEELAAELNLLNAIGSVPFLHLIMRPSVVKHAGGYRPPLEQYNLLLKDLLMVGTRQKLILSLITNEQQFLKRQEQQKNNLGIHKIREPRDRSISVNSASLPKLQTEAQVSSEGTTKKAEDHEASEASETSRESPNHTKSDVFELRPFRTRITPRPSPSSSPVGSRPKTNEGKHAHLGPLAPMKIEAHENRG